MGQSRRQPQTHAFRRAGPISAAVPDAERQSDGCEYGAVPETLAQIHNRVAKHAITEIVYPTIVAGGDAKAVLLLLESVVAGVLSATVLMGVDEKVLDVLQGRVRQRIAAMRLGELAGIGSLQ